MIKKIDVNKFLQQGSKITLNGINFDQINWSNLIVNEEENFLEHLQKQAAGLAYYGFLYRQAKQQLRRIQKQKQDKLTQKVSQAMVALQKMGKTTKLQAQAMATMTHKTLFDKYDKQIQQLTQQVDLLQNYYNAWQQKGYALNNMTSLINNGIIKLK